MNPSTSHQEPDLKIVTFDDMSQMPEDQLQQLAAKEREWYGYGMEEKGFGEYAVCPGSKCRRIFSVEDIYPQINEAPDGYVALAKLEANSPALPCCPDCDEQIEHLLDPQYFAEYLRLYFSQEVYGALLMQDDEIKGAVSAFKAPFLNAFEGNINYRQGYNMQEVIEAISKITGKTAEEVAALEVACCNRIAVDKDVRGQGYLPKLVSAVLNQHPEHDDLPSLGDAKATGPVYPLAVVTGYEPITEDAYGNTLFYSDRFGDFRDAFNLTRDEFIERFGAKMGEVRQMQRVHAKAGPREPRRIKGVPLLRERFQQIEDDDENAFETEAGKRFRVETITSAELTDEKLKEITDFFRYMFNNAYGGQYLVYPSQAEPISAQTVFGISEDEYASLDQLDSFDPATYPPHPETGEQAVFWHDPQTVFENFKNKSAENGHFALVRDCKTNELAGLMFGHACTVQEVFEGKKSEEWENPLNYAGIKNPDQCRDFEDFLDKINDALRKNGWEEISPETEIYGWNCIATRQDVRGLENLLKMTKQFFASIPDEMKEELMVIGEAIHQSRAHALFKTGGAIDVPGILVEGDTLKKGDPQIGFGTLAKFAETFSLSIEDFLQRMKKMLSK